MAVKRSCKGCTKREIGCHSWCPDWAKEDAAHQEEKAAIYRAKNHPADLYLNGNIAKNYEHNKQELKEKRQRIGRSCRRP